MIRAFCNDDLDHIMQIWLEGNIKAHFFIDPQYWQQNYAFVKAILPQAEIYVYENDISSQPDGFIGITGNFINGIFVRTTEQNKGIGRQLLDYAQSIKNELYLKVYERNVPAVAFYNKAQFEIKDQYTDIQTGEKEFLMHWRK